MSGAISGVGVQDLLNELHNAGAEALAVADVRVVAGTVVDGNAGALSVENAPLGDTFEISALGNPATLTGSLTRAGGIVAQLAATYPDAQVTVMPVDVVEIPAATAGPRPGTWHSAALIPSRPMTTDQPANRARRLSTSRRG